MATPNHEFPNLELIRQGIQYRFKIKTRGLELNCRPLSVFEEDQIAQEVLEEMEALPQHRRTSLRESIAMAVKKLEKAQTSDIGLSDAKVYAKELERMTPGEIDHLFKQYNACCDKVNPVIERMNPDDVEKGIAVLKKNSTEAEKILTESSFFQLVSICLHLLPLVESPSDS